jgi:hypothetical protein
MGGTCTAYWEGEKYRLSWVGTYEERDHLEDLSVDGMMTLSWIFKKYYGRAWTGFICFWIRTSGMPL